MMSHDLVQRFLKSVDERRSRDGAEDVPKDEDPREMAGGGQILTLGEVSLVLKNMESSLMEHAPEATLPSMLRKTMEYVDRFKKGDEVATLQQMREACHRYGLSQYEVVTICNLMPETAEQARVLLPDLKRHAALDDNALQSLLDTLRSFLRR